MNQQCKCGKGHVSAWDGKCGNCRTKQEQHAHNKAIQSIPDGCSDAYEAYRFIRWGK